MIREQWITSYWMLFIAIFLAFFANLGGFPLFDLDEGAFSEATREMLASGNFAATYLDGEPRYDKPILSYWFQAISVSLFGVNEFAFRLPSAIASTLWVFATYLFAKEQWNRETGLFAALFMAVTLWITGIGHAAIADAWLNLFISLTLFDIWRYRQSPSKSLVMRIYFWMALGVLTKGPVAIAVPLLASGIFFILAKDWKLWLGAIFNPLGWLVLLATISPWLFMVYQDQGIGFFKGFLVDHNLERFSDTREGHGGNYFYYFLVLPLIIMPFAGVLFKAVGNSKTLIKDDLNRFLIIWFLVVFALVSVSQTQLPHYVLYGVTGLILLFAGNRDKLANAQWQLWIPYAFVMLLASLPFIIGYAVGQTDRQYESAMLGAYESIFTWEYYLAGAILMATGLWIVLKKAWSISSRLVAIGVLQTAFMFHFVMPNLADLQQTPVKEAAQFVQQQPERHVVRYAIKMPSFSVYRQAMTHSDDPKAGDLVFTRIDKLESFNSKYPTLKAKIVFQKGGIVILDVAS